MESLTIIFFVLFLIIFSIIGIGYIIYESLKYKQDLEISLDNNTKDVKNKFYHTSNKISIMNDNITSNKTSFQNFSSNILYMSSNISNILTNNIVNNSNLTNQLLNNFDNNLSKYFVFNEGGRDIRSATNNTRIFNYLFGTSTTQNLDLIQKTTALGGITVKTGVSKELKICNTRGENCIKMEIDDNNNFYLSPSDSSQNIYIGGENQDNAAIRINGQDVYIKNLHIENEDSNFIEPLKTECIINIKPNTNNGNNYDTYIKARVFFESSYNINSNKNLFIYIPYIDIGKYNTVITNTQETNIYISLYKSTDMNVTISGINYIGYLTIKFNNVTNIPAGYILDFSIILTNKENITSLSNTTTNFTFTTKSYFMQ